MDAFLDFLGFYRSDVAKDRSCLFRVVSEELFYTQVHHARLRDACVQYMGRNRRMFEQFLNQDFEEYLEKIKTEQEWAGEVEMTALSLKYKIDFVIYYEISKPPLKISSPSAPHKTVLACSGSNRYDCVYQKSTLSSLAFCQAVVYEILYKRVFELGSDVDVAVEKMLHDKAYSKQRRNNLCLAFKESSKSIGASDNFLEDDQTSKNPRLEIRKALAQGIPPFPYKVAKTLDSGIYRNVEFDIWNEKRKEEQKNEQLVIPKLEPGVKCKVYINKEKYTGHIQDIYSDCDNVCIYVEELCERCVVSSSALEVMPVPAYKVLTWQGGKTYKVYADNSVSGNVSDTEKLKGKKGNKKNVQESPTHNGNSSLKQNTIIRSNSLPSSAQHNFIRNNSLHCSPVFNRKKNHTSTPISHKSKMSFDKVHNQQPLHSTPNFSYVWNGIGPKLSSGSPAFRKDVSDSYQMHSKSPETLNELNDCSWSDESIKNSSVTQYPVSSAYGDTGYSSMSVNAFSNSSVLSNATSLPLPIPGTHTAPPVSDDLHPTQCPPMTVYPVYAVPSMYLVCRDGTSVPVNIGTWGTQETGTTADMSAGIPSIIFNSPPTGMSPPLTSWIPGTVANFGASWPPAMSSNMAFTSPLDISAYQPIISPPWSPPSGIFIPPPPVAYQIPTSQARSVPQESAEM